jgi:precorrin-6B C5,15-methyltransferase / cobalt-precorrin-6B C5,C15-methyltransferase
MEKWLSIIGINEDGIDGLSSVARFWLDRAEILVGGDRHLKLIPSLIPLDERKRLTWQSPLINSIQEILTYQNKSVCVLASGDPMWYGIGTTLLQHIPLEQMRIVPAVSTFSLICARLGWAIANVETLSLCGRPVENLISFLYPNAKILLLSADRHTPKLVIELLRKKGYGKSKIWILEHLQGEEKISEVTAEAELGSIEIADLNAIALECIAESQTFIISRLPGLPDSAYIHDGQLTKSEVRAITLSALAPKPGELLWDVGAGCGSIGIEWMRTDFRCKAIAIEPKRIEYIAQNAISLGTPNLEIIEGIAPEALQNLPSPNAIFIGGGITSEDTIEKCWHSLKPGGRLVANVVTIEGEQQIFAWQQKIGGSLKRIAIERMEAIGTFKGWKPMATVTQWIVTKDY